MKNFHEMCLILEKDETKFEQEFLIWEECNQIDENWLTTPLKFAAGAVGNLAGQTGRALGNVASGVVGNVGAAGDLGLGTLQMIGGGRKKGWDRVKKGLASAGRSGARIGRGVTQAMGALSGVTPILRGAQAASEPMFDVKGVYAPSNVKKGSFSDLFGMGSWEEENPETNNAPEQKISDTRPKVKSQDTSKSKKQGSEPKQSSNSEKKWEGPEPNDECKKLIRMYKSIKNSKIRKQIQKKMAVVDPVWYSHAMQKAKARIKSKS